MSDIDKLKDAGKQAETATDLLYPEGESGGPVQSGLPPEPAARSGS